MKITFKNTPEQVELIKAAGSKNKVVSAEAMEALAAFVAPVAQQVLSTAGTSNLIFSQFTYNEDDSPSVPLDLFYNAASGLVTVWSQTIAGGLPSSQISGVEDLKIATFRLDSAISLSKKYARRARLDVVAKSLTKMVNEVLIKKERNAWAILLRAVAEGSTNGLAHVIAATTANVFQVDDINRLLTRSKRINTGIDETTPDSGDSKGMTDLFCSPEVIEQVRAMAYQPVNTRNGATTTSGATSLALPDSIRSGMFNTGGVQEIFGVNLHEVYEFGDARRYNAIFKEYYTGSFTAATDQVAVGIDLTRETCLSPVAQNADTGATFEVMPDDQYVSRQDKLGFFGSQELGYVCLDSRNLVAITI